MDLFDHLVGECEQLRWDFKAKCLRGLEIDHKLPHGLLKHRQVGRLLASENPAGIISQPLITFGNILRVAHQAARHGKLPPRVNCGQWIGLKRRERDVTPPLVSDYLDHIEATSDEEEDA
jgi:hypothetical protein